MARVLLCLATGLAILVLVFRLAELPNARQPAPAQPAQPTLRPTISTNPRKSPERTAAVLLAAVVALLAGCAGAPQQTATSGIPRALLREARPIGVGPRFQPPATGPITGPCRPTLGSHYGVHVEVFAADRVVILPAGIGTQPPRTIAAGRITNAHCYGNLVTLEPTGVVLVRAQSRPTLATLFQAWGQRLSITHLATFQSAPGTRVAVFIDGHRSDIPPDLVPLKPHSEIVLEIGPYVPPHASYTFPPGT